MTRPARPASIGAPATSASAGSGDLLAAIAPVGEAVERGGGFGCLGRGGRWGGIGLEHDQG